MKPNANKSAYPTPLYESGCGTIYPDNGMTKREAFAMAAMRGMLANPSFDGTLDALEAIATDSVTAADLTLAALEPEA
jgi:hypothetical protein